MEFISIGLTAIGWVASPLVTKLINNPRDRQNLTAKQKLNLLEQFVEFGRNDRVPHGHGQDDHLYSKNWLRRFKDAFYDAENTIYSNESAIDDNQINDILGIIEELNGENNHHVLSQMSIQPEIPTWRRTTYLMSRQIIGRTMQINILNNWLLSDQSSIYSNKNFSILSIIGTGGIGKTILSQLAFNSQEVQNFEVRAWVFLYEPNRPTIHIDGVTSVSSGFEDFHNIFVSTMKNKRFFMVLDDVWDDLLNEWDKYCSLFNCGSPGSKITVTTQIKGVANVINSDPESQIDLDVLQPDECLNLFMESAFDNRRPPDYYAAMEIVCERISMRFGYSPLAAVKVGCELKSSLDQERLELILRHKFCITDRRDGDIISILGFCYKNLPGRLKQCYLSCALFPRNYQFEKHQLNLIWIGMGFVHYGSPAANYVDDFSIRSFFIARTDNKYVFHHVLHELAEYISDGDFFRLEEQTMKSECIEIPEEARHVYISADNFAKASEALTRNEKLRSLVIDAPSNPYDEKFFMKSLEKVLKNLKSLRFLVLSVLPQSLPTTVGKLKYLRYLEFPSNQKKFPKLSDSFKKNYKLKRWDSKYLLVAKDVDKLIKQHCSSANMVDETF